MARLLLLLMLFTPLLLLGACKSTQTDEPGPGAVSGVGTIRFIELEGGFYGLVTDDGEQLNPLNLEGRFKEDGLRVRFEGDLADDVMTIQMWGKPVRIRSIEPL